MDVTEENMTAKEMLEKIAELNYSQSQLRDQNDEMRHWLDVADDDMAVLRSENTSLLKRLKALEKIICEVQQVETKPCRSLLADDLDAKRCSEKKMQELEKDSAVMKEQNKKLTAELKSLEQERDQDKISLNKLSVALRTLECGNEEAQLGLQLRDEVIHQKNLLLKNSEETLEEYSNIIKDLRLKNQELRSQLEDRLDEFAALNHPAGEEEGSLCRPLSFAEEVKLLASSAELKTSMSDSLDLRHEESEEEELVKDIQTKRCAGILEAAVKRAGLFLLFVFTLAVLAFVASGSCARTSGGFSPIDMLWNFARVILQPYCRVHYGALPPV